MAQYFLSASGADANDGTTWATARLTISSVASLATTKDDIVFVDKGWSQTLSANTTISTAGKQVPFLCVDSSTWPTVTETTGAALSFSTNSTVLNGCYYLKGFNIPTTCNLNASLGRVLLENITFNNHIFFGSNSSSTAVHEMTFKNCWWNPTTTAMSTYIGKGLFRWYGGGISSTAIKIQKFLNPVLLGIGFDFFGYGIDFTNADPSFNPFCVNYNCKQVLTNCKLPTNWTGSLATSTNYAGASQTFEMYNCDTTASNYRIMYASDLGFLRETTSITKVNGATDGTTALAWVITNNTNALNNIGARSFNFATPPIAYWNDTVGTPITVSLDVLTNSSTLLYNNNIWLEVEYLGDSSSTMSTIVDSRGPILSTATVLPTSPATWNGTSGFTNAQLRQLSVTITPQMKGFIVVKVHIAFTTAVIYIDPKLMVA